MKKVTNRIIYVLIIVVLLSVITGCASYRNKKAFMFEEELVRAGFQVKPANTPEKLAHIKAMPQDKLIRHEYKGKLYYIFPNVAAEGIYIGTENDYKTFKENLREDEMNKKRESTWGQNIQEMIWQGECTFFWCDWDLWYDNWYN